ncbi:Zinc ABC transporter, ATP-binding protein ZnuC [Streptococcus oralis]|uniref:Zinc ABC transporter, ATP-binding protein ZnuC n=1 Tax=Streptococcus oralis TaxID=1303 RepID=A0A139RHA4_STROR|nr:ATP-binding cassette domain-containing protein [Streptococcus oralis]KXU14055.1 Zinc ABC transporter, ATP-binding protein ZnuC [Streptococcus oralis]
MKVENISYRVNSRILFDHISFDTSNSGLTLITGKNGSGKSTLLKVLLGIVQPSSGSLISNEKISYVPDSSNNYFIGLSPNLLFDFLQKQFFIETSLFEERLRELREQFYLNEKLMTQTIQSLSLGEKKKVMLIAAFLLDSDLYVMDEPLSGLDQISVENLIHLIEQKIKLGKHFIMVSHERQEILPTVDQIISL